ncbi:MAG: hypothetical protein CM15mP70_10780 [Pelagibacteraceae bacterium]|nr:MAG: hypothetical protein CM15mP70_10780 [Pelagibacteraceae bacterium]
MAIDKEKKNEFEEDFKENCLSQPLLIGEFIKQKKNLFISNSYLNFFLKNQNKYY